MKISFRFFTVAIFYIFSLAAHAATLNVSSTGILLGASGVIVNGTSYDVSFQDGTCVAVFSGCNQSTDFTFTTQTTANAASQALLNQVLLDVPAQGYAFDSTPSTVNGCSTVTPQRCSAYTPIYTFTTSSNQPAVYVSYARNESGTNLDGVANVGELISTDTGSYAYQIEVWAVWSPTPAAPAVPVPAAAWLFCSGLLGLAGLSRKRTAHA